MSTTKFSADHDQSQQHHPVLDHQRVAIGDRLQHEAAEPRQDEHVLDHDRARDQVGELQPHDGEDRRQRVRQRVAPERGAARDALGARGAHEVLVQGLDHRRPCDARDDRRLRDAKRDRRKDQRAERPRGVRPAGKSARGNEPQRHREDQHEQDREPEVRHGDADLAEAHDDRIARAAAPIRGVDACRKPDDRGERHRHQRQRRADRKARGDQRSDRRAIGVREAEIAVQSAADPARVADGRRQIEAELVRERRDRLGRRRRPQHGLRRVARQDLHDREHDQRGDAGASRRTERSVVLGKAASPRLQRACREDEALDARSLDAALS